MGYPGNIDRLMPDTVRFVFDKKPPLGVDVLLWKTVRSLPIRVRRVADGWADATTRKSVDLRRYSATMRWAPPAGTF